MGVTTPLDELELWDGELFMLSRRRRGISQLELQRLTGVPQVAISRWEAGAAMPAEYSEMLWELLSTLPLRSRPTRSATSRAVVERAQVARTAA